MAKTQTSTKTAARSGAPTTAAKAKAESLKATKIGVVESDKRDKTRTVVVSYLDRHPKYGKYVGKRTVLNVHDEGNEAVAGDIVEVVQCRPVSKSKFWRLVRVVEKRSATAAAPASAAEIK